MGEEMSFGPGVLFTQDGREIGVIEEVHFEPQAVTYSQPGWTPQQGTITIQPMEFQVELDMSHRQHRRFLAVILGWRCKAHPRWRMVEKAERLRTKAVII